MPSINRKVGVRYHIENKGLVKVDFLSGEIYDSFPSLGSQKTKPARNLLEEKIVPF